ncbi:hypothetical protein CSUI_009520 [Cystoisospora suis]|uniref:Uncharacterized protein n=1 Tax=Cystoisospora suis TaxID=483139 RepID=A0A2C6KJS4_9APIC|nr:hypothetical protein CSUI_009520 [Cystoisospora suis]
MKASKRRVGRCTVARLKNIEVMSESRPSKDQDDRREESRRTRMKGEKNRIFVLQTRCPLVRSSRSNSTKGQCLVKRPHRSFSPRRLGEPRIRPLQHVASHASVFPSGPRWHGPRRMLPRFFSVLYASASLSFFVDTLETFTAAVQSVSV